MRWWRESSLGHRVEVIFLQCTGATLAMHTTALCFSILLSTNESAIYSMVVLLLITTLALRVGCPRLAQAATVGALGDWAAFFVDVDQSSLCSR